MTRIFIDMDGTLAKWTPSATPEQLLEPGFFINMPPEINVVQMANLLVRKEESNDIQVYILSAVMQENKLAVPEKNDWLDEYVDVAPERRIFVPCGENKAEYLPGGIQPSDILIDDYSVNLHSWEKSGGIGIKMLNGVNGTKGTWKNLTISTSAAPTKLAEAVLDIASVELMEMDELVETVGSFETFLKLPKNERLTKRTYTVQPSVTRQQLEIRARASLCS